MADTNNKNEQGLVQEIVQLFKQYYRYSTLTAAQKITVVSVSMILFLMVFTLSLFALLFLGIALGMWLGDMFKNPIAGFFMVSGFFIFLLLIMAVFRKPIVRLLRNLIVKKIFSR